jgi:hypothetical protein
MRRAGLNEEARELMSRALEADSELRLEHHDGRP